VKFETWQKMLLGLSLVIVLFGMFIGLLNGTSLFKPFGDQFDQAFWPSGGISDQVRQFQQWVYGVLGATMVGWGIFMFFIVKNAFPKREKWAWNCVMIGVLIWYLIDTGLSGYHGVGANMLLNTVILILIMVPLLMMRREMVK
jgi:hypothetical protein